MSTTHDREAPVLRLYVAGRSPISLRAHSNMRQIDQDFFGGRCQIEIVDVLDAPQRAVADGILVTPTLIKLSPAPSVRIIGDLSLVEKVLFSLGRE